MLSFYQEIETKGESERSWRTSKGRDRVSLLRADTHSTWKSNSILHEMSLETLSLSLSLFHRSRFINSVSTETWLKNPQSACCHEANNTPIQFLSKEVLVPKIYKAPVSICIKMRAILRAKWTLHALSRFQPFLARIRFWTACLRRCLHSRFHPLAPTREEISFFSLFSREIFRIHLGSACFQGFFPVFWWTDGCSLFWSDRLGSRFRKLPSMEHFLFMYKFERTWNFTLVKS